MAQKRMFNKKLTNSDEFLDLPDSSQVLYFHLNMNADDDGFINNWKSIIRMTGTKEDDMKILIAKQFIIPFESGVIVIKHWRMNNYLRSDRYTKTDYVEELTKLKVDDNGEYFLTNEQLELLTFEQKTMDSIDKRKKAYEESDLPYSFTYKIRKAFNGKICPICGYEMLNNTNGIHRPTIQHNIPISKGGKHELGNISVICHQCNVSIRDKETGELNAKEVIEIWDKLNEKITGIPNYENGIPSIDKNRIEKNSIDNKYIYSREVDEIIDYLNDKLNTNYKKTTKKTRSLIKARLDENFKVEDFIKVIDNKYYEWYNTEYQIYLRPETLFGTKFESYLNQKPIRKKKTIKDISFKEIDKEIEKCKKLNL